MLIDVSGVCVVQMAVVQIVDVTFMLYRGVPATGAMRMGMLIVSFVIAHFTYPLLGSNVSLGSTFFFRFDGMGERIKHQFRYVAVRHRIESMLSLAPARHHSGIAEPPEPFGYR
jgi:hypothetical protein